MSLLPRAGLSAALALSLSMPASAAVASGPTWSFSGFGTLGWVHSDEREADFTSSPMKASGAGRSEHWSPDVDSRLGAQLDVTAGRWSAVMQVVTEQRLDRSYRPQVEWANIKFQATPELALRFGRIALPTFLAADSRKVGYSYPWVRPPVEVYGLLPLPSSDGVDVSWRWDTDTVRQSTQLIYGRATVKMQDYGTLKVHRLAGLSHTAERGPLTARLSLLVGDVTLDVASELFTGLSQFGETGVALTERYDVDHKRNTVASVALSYDPGRWFATGEWGHTHARSYLGKTSHLYASAGVRRGAFTCWAGYARIRPRGHDQETGLPLAGLDPVRAMTGERLNAGLNALLESVPVQSTVSAGVRWDARENLALKLQWDRVRPRDGSPGMLVNTSDEFRSGHTIDVASIVADFVF